MSKKANEKERSFHKTIMDQGCCVCGAQAVFHHVNRPMPHQRRDHTWGAALCHLHHSKFHDKFGNNDEFYKAYGIQLEEEAGHNKKEYWDANA